MKKIVLASGNKDKLKELKELIANIEIVSIGDLLPGWDVEETGLTLEANALLKAHAACKATGKIAIADDTGLFVWALGDAPGIYTARYAGDDCTYKDNTEKLLNSLTGETAEKRKASFQTVVAFVKPNGEEYTFHGIVEGFITESNSGLDGFGYDPVFFATEIGKTFAECSLQEKNKISHRSRAIGKLNEFISENSL